MDFFVLRYNLVMERLISFIVIGLVSDVLVALAIKRMMNLKTHFFMFAFLQILNVLVGVLFIYFKFETYIFVLLKIAVIFIITLLVADDYNLKPLSLLFLCYVVLTFSVLGFLKFLVLVFKCVLFDIFCIKFSYLLDIVVLFGIILYIFAIFWCVYNLTKKKKLKTFLMKVSFLAFGKHIEIVGLLDTGNSLYDTKTKKAVIVVSCQALKKYLPKNIYKNITNNNFNELGLSNIIEYVSVGGKILSMPIVDVGSVKIDDGVCVKKFDCVLGISSQPFAEKDYECLLHRDFV